MAKVINLFGIRKKAILSRIKVMGNTVYTVMRPIIEENEKALDVYEKITIDDRVIVKDNIYCYGEININNEEDVNYIKKFNIINLEDNNSIHSNYDFETGEVAIEGNVAKMHDCYDVIKWFKYNYLLIGKPERIIIYKCRKEDL